LGLKNKNLKFKKKKQVEKRKKVAASQPSSIWGGLLDTLE